MTRNGRGDALAPFFFVSRFGSLLLVNGRTPCKEYFPLGFRGACLNNSRCGLKDKKKHEEGLARAREAYLAAFRTRVLKDEVDARMGKAGRGRERERERLRAEGFGFREVRGRRKVREVHKEEKVMWRERGGRKEMAFVRERR